MKKTLLSKAAGRVLSEYGRKWGRSLGNKAVQQACEAARRRGLTDRRIDLDTLLGELRTMHRQGRLNKEELRQAFQAAHQAWRNRR